MKRWAFYKYTYEEYLPKILDGTGIKVGTLDEYRALDTPGFGDGVGEEFVQSLRPVSGIEDPTENVSIDYLDRYSRGDPLNDDTRAFLIKAFGIAHAEHVGEGFYARQNCLITQGPNGYVFCGSRYKRQSTIKEVKANSAHHSDVNRPYDVGIPIVDPIGFAAALSAAISRQEGWEDIPDTIVDDVDYIDVVRHVGLENPRVPHPLKKHYSFSGQKEHRVVICKYIEPRKSGQVVELECDCSGFFGKPFKI